MITLSDIIPNNIFSIPQFTQYATNMRERSTSNENEYGTLQAKIVAGSFLCSYLVCALFAFIITVGPLQTNILVFYGDIIIAAIPALGIGAGVAILSKQYIDQQLSNEQQSLTNSLIPWQQQYNQAWNNIIAPQMMRTLTAFDAFSNEISESHKYRPEYIKMLCLSQNIRQAVSQPPVLDINTNFTEEPDFITLNTMMDTYQSWRTA